MPALTFASLNPSDTEPLAELNEDSSGTDAQATRGQDAPANSAKGASRRKPTKQPKTNGPGRSCADACQASDSEEATRPSGKKAAASEDESESFSSCSLSASPKEARPDRSGNWRRQRRRRCSPIASSASSNSSSERESSRRRAGATDGRNEGGEATLSAANRTATLLQMKKTIHAGGQGRARLDLLVNHCMGASGRARAARERSRQSASCARNQDAKHTRLVASRIRRR